MPAMGYAVPASTLKVAFLPRFRAPAPAAEPIGNRDHAAVSVSHWLVVELVGAQLHPHAAIERTGLNAPPGWPGQQAHGTTPMVPMRRPWASPGSYSLRQGPQRPGHTATTPEDSGRLVSFYSDVRFQR